MSVTLRPFKHGDFGQCPRSQRPAPPRKQARPLRPRYLHERDAHAANGESITPER